MSAPSLKKIRALVIDVDGVLLRGSEPLPGVDAFFEFLRGNRISYLVATNHSGRPASDVVSVIAKAGARIEEAQVLTSSRATARLLPRIAPNARSILMVGGPALSSALTQAGYRMVDGDADAVVVGLDLDLTYDKLKRAAREIRRGAKFIGTNADRTFPVADGVDPGSGAILAALEAASDVKPIVVGKPERYMFDLALETMGSTAASTATLGDRLDTDIEGGLRAGLKSILLLTGVTNKELLRDSTIKPDWVFEDLDDLRLAWQAALND